jgi:hypothetical protein
MNPQEGFQKFIKSRRDRIFGTGSEESIPSPKIIPDQGKGNVIHRHVKLHPAIARITIDKLGRSPIHNLKTNLHKSSNKTSHIDYAITESGDLNFLKKRLTNLGEAKAPTDAVSKSYVDNQIQQVIKLIRRN